jgi:hypothetical protein
MMIGIAVLIYLLVVMAEESNAQATESFITGFKKPANLFSITNTPWIVVNEFSRERDEPGAGISLLNVITQQRVAFSSLPTASVLSDFASPDCTPRSLNQLSLHGIDGRPHVNGEDGKWEIAAVNHFAYESIEFYEFNFLTSPPTIASMGCTVIADDYSANNGVTFSPDGSKLAISLYYNTYYGILGTINYYWSFLRAFVLPGGDGGLLLVSPGGSVTLSRKNLNGANVILWQEINSVCVTENPSGTILRIDPSSNAKNDVTILKLPLPDNLARQGESFLATQIDSSFPYVTFCAIKSILTGKFCDIDFSVVEVNSATDESRVIYSSTVDWQVTGALIKDNIMYIGNYETDRILRVEGF